MVLREARALWAWAHIPGTDPWGLAPSCTAPGVPCLGGTALVVPGLGVPCPASWVEGTAPACPAGRVCQGTACPTAPRSLEAPAPA